MPSKLSEDSEIDHDDDPDMPAGPPLSEITDITATDPIAILKFSQEALNVWAFPKKRKGITSTEQGARIINVFKGLIVRRSYASTLNGRRLDKDLPSVQRMVFECEYSPQERQHYDAAYADNYKIKKLKEFREKNGDARRILRDLRATQIRKGLPKDMQVTVPEAGDTQVILQRHDTG
ncbi:hypothetical protein J4E85_007627 [Alternaria conjuncta]|uniref:uncharacterized protein n=1 Tax=Alternaria conjuncta TaxID=181017 RepID=UPI002220CE46|nr:uncharacterized protein J4E85_007627 [Alternaria conjuncta]KAI4924511.1 hypothetical protein J4E85_007627 [Alternaria conjuncta]